RACDRVGIESVEEEGGDVLPEWPACWLQDPVGYCLEPLPPLPSLVSVHLFEMIEIVLHTDGFVISTDAVDNDSTLLGHTIKQLGEVWQVGEIPSLVHDKDRVVESVDVERVRQGRCRRALLTEEGDLMAELLPDPDVLGYGIDRACESIDLRHEEQPHVAPPL